jgi:hypothetical protein
LERSQWLAQVVPVTQIAGDGLGSEGVQGPGIAPHLQAPFRQRDIVELDGGDLAAGQGLDCGSATCDSRSEIAVSCGSRV